jgi:CheY-like chemotaxis protein
MQLRHPHPADPAGPETGSWGGAGSRLNLLLARGRGTGDGAAFERIPRLLEPLGVRSIATDSGEDAAELIRREPVHVAVIDWSVPLRAGDPGAGPAGPRILQLLRRLRPAPPAIVIRPRQPVSRERVRGLHDCLREGAFAVLDQPLDREILLEVLRRVLKRHYAGHWPG